MPQDSRARYSDHVWSRRWHRQSLLVLLAVGCLNCGVENAFAEESRSPAEILGDDFNLRKSKSNRWLLFDERKLTADMQELSEIRQRIVLLQTEIRNQRNLNLARWRQLQQAQRQLADLNRRGGSNADFAAATTQVALLKRSSVSPQKIGDTESTRATAVSLIVAMQELQLLTADLSRRLAELETEYLTLAQSSNVLQLLEELDPAGKLGPSLSPRQVRRRLAEFSKFPGAEEVPVYLEAGRVRVGGIVNDRFPATFSWSENASQTVVTHAMYRAWTGNEPTKTSVIWQPESGNEIICRQGEIDYLRMGPAVVRGMPVLVLPPGKDSVGAILGPEVFPGYRTTLRLEQVSLEFQSREE